MFWGAPGRARAAGGRSATVLRCRRAPQGHSCSRCVEPGYTVFAQSALLNKMFMHASAPTNFLAGLHEACSPPRLRLPRGLGKGLCGAKFRGLLPFLPMCPRSGQLSPQSLCP